MRLSVLPVLTNMKFAPPRFPLTASADSQERILEQTRINLIPICLQTINLVPLEYTLGVFSRAECES
jgi:hypothetical protein